MPKTEVRSGQIKDATVGRSDINTATAGEAVVRKIVSGTGISLSSTGADTGTGDVTITASGGGAPAAHATTHKSGGSDPIKLDELATPTDVTTLNATTSAHGLLRKLPNVPTQWLDGQGNWSTPSSIYPAPHQSSHQFGAADELLNATWTNRDNTFTGYLYNNVSVDPGLYTQATAGTVNQRRWSISGQAAQFIIIATDDTFTFQAAPLTCLRNGDVKIGADVYEKGRSVATGHWQTIPFSASNFSAVGGGTWTVGSAAVIANRYTLIGKTMHWSIYISWFSGSNTVAGTVTTLVIANPGFTFAGSSYSAVGYGIDAGVYTDMLVSPAGSGTINITKKNGANFTAGSPGIITAMTWEIV